MINVFKIFYFMDKFLQADMHLILTDFLTT